MTIIPHKRCSKCGVDKPLSEYHKDKQTSSGFTYACRECRRLKTKQWQSANNDRRVAYGTQWRSEKREYDKQRKAVWYQGRSEQQRDRVRLWRKNNPEKRRAQIRAYYKAKPDKIRTIAARRRARIIGQGGSYTEQEWVSLKTHYDYTCLRCNRREPDIRLTADHVIPIARNGSSYIDNIQPLCDECNRWKNVRTIDFRERQGC